MPFLNAQGRALHGVGGNRVNLDDVPIRGQFEGSQTTWVGAMGWKDDYTAVFSGQLDPRPSGTDAHGLCIMECDVRRLVHTEIKDANGKVIGHEWVGPVTPVAPHNVSFGRARGGVWAGTVGGDPRLSKPFLGLISSTGFEVPRGALHDIGPDGAIAYKPEYQSNGPHRIRERNGHDWEFAGDFPIGDVWLPGGIGRAIWQTGFRLGTVGMPVPVTDGAAAGPIILDVNGRDWLLYRQVDRGWRLVIHPCDTLTPLHVVETENIYGFNAVVKESKVLVTWASRAGEQAGDLRMKTVDLSTVLPPPPPPPPPPVKGEVMLRAYEHTAWIAPHYSFGEVVGGTPVDRYTGNAILLVERSIGEGRIDAGMLERELAKYAPFEFPLIVDGTHREQHVHPYRSQMAAWWVTGGQPTADATGVVVEIALDYSVEAPVIAYLDASAWPPQPPSWFDAGRVWPAVQAYRPAGESLQVFDSRVRGQLDRVKSWGGEVALTPRFDDFNGSTSVAHCLENMALYDRWMREYQIIAFMPFADRRGNGIAKNADLYAWAKAFLYAVPSGRPGRFDGFQPKATTWKATLLNKLGQSRRLVSLSPKDRDEIRRLLQ